TRTRTRKEGLRLAARSRRRLSNRMSTIPATLSWPNFEADAGKAQALGGPAWLQDIRRAGAERFAALGLPHHRQEAWRFTNIAPIAKAGFRPVLNQPGRAVTATEVTPLL